ncbi:MAG: OpgC domain-containing protein [Pseudomonadota bacterium]
MSVASTNDSGLSGREADRSRAAAAPVVRTRDPRLDFFRGIAMIIILFAHTPGNYFTQWIPARWGFSDATEMFVFCSGMASAIAFGNTFDRSGWALGTARVGYRVWQVYWAHIGMFFVIAALMAILNATELFERDYIGQLNLYPFFNRPAEQIAGLMTLTYVPNYFDILPMYMAILVMMPLVMLLAKVDLRLVAVVCIMTWIFGQTALLESIGLGAWHFEFPAEPWSDRTWFFNPFGWQLIFFTGFAFMIGWIPAPPINKWLIGLALFIVLLNVPFSNIGVREFGFEWARDWRIENRGWFTKSDFGILRFVQFLSLAYLAYVLVGKGGRFLMPTGADLGSRIWAFVVAQLSKIGQQSLAVFLFSMVLARLLGVVYDQFDRAREAVTIGNLIGVGLLLAVAYLVAWFKGEPWRGKRAK